MSSAGANERRLAAIVFTDVAGYSARMQQDETGTMALVRADFARMRELCTGHGGEILKSTGDGLLLCFSSVVQAVACALQIQAEFSARPADALQHRIGIHLGDVFREGGDVTGDGVNIAARLQTKARPGTVCLSQSVYDAVQGKLPMQVQSLGAQSFKNITQPITVYLAMPAGSAVAVRPRGIFRGWWLAGEVGLAAALLVFAFWPKPGVETTAVQPAPVAPVPDADDKSIAVLPFTNMSEDRDNNAFFADGIHEDILTNLSNIRELRVVSRTSVMQYRGTTNNISQIAAKLGVAYILEGSVRRIGHKVRVTGQLIKAGTDEHVWAKAYDRDLTDIFALQAELAQEITQALHAVLSPQEKARLARIPTTNPAAYELYLKARDIMNREGRSGKTLPRAETLLQGALELDPGFASAWGELAIVHLLTYNRTNEATPARLEKARLAVEMTERLAPEAPESWFVLASYYGELRDYPRANGYLIRAAAALPNNVNVIRLLCEVDKNQGRWPEALSRHRQAYKLDPQNRSARAGLVNWLKDLRRYDEVMAFTQQQSDPFEGYMMALLPFHQRGSAQELQAWIAAHPDSGFALISAIFTGSAADYVRLADEARRKAPSGMLGVHVESNYASALIALGETSRAREVATRNLARLKTIVGADLFLEAQNLAVLGEKQAALDSLAAEQARFRKDGVITDFMVNGWLTPFILAELGEKEAALAEFARLLKVPSSLNVHMIRRAWSTRQLQGDPAFEALVNDPKNNAPLL